MRRVFVGMIMVLAGGAVAADWSVQPFGSLSKLSDLDPPESMTISGEAGGDRTSPMPDIDTAISGGVTITSVPQSGRGIFGIDFEFLGGSDSIEAPLMDAELGAPVVDSSTSAYALGGFFAGVLPWISGESYFGSLGAGLGFFHSSRDTDVSFRERHVDALTSAVTIVDVSESASISTSSVFINVFVREEFRLSNRFQLAATLGYRGVPSKPATVETESLTGSYKPEFSGLYLRLGVKIDI